MRPDSLPVIYRDIRRRLRTRPSRLAGKGNYLLKDRVTKLAAIADIHRNCVALEAVLADITALGISHIGIRRRAAALT